jgi:peptidoglycan hydrolase CwlO-like protein
MCKKFLIAGVAVALGLLVVKKTEVGSHLRAWWKDGKNFVQNSIPIPTEIDRLKGEIDRLDSVYRSQFEPFAEEAVSVEKLRNEIAQIEKKLEQQKTDIQTMKTDLSSGVSKITYGDVSYPRERVEADLSRRFASFKVCQAGLKAKQELLEAKEEKLSHARNRLEEMKNAKAEMQTELARLEAEYEGVKAAQVKSNFHIDDSELSRIKESMARLQDRVKVEKKKLELAGQFLTSPVKVSEKVEKRDLIKEIDTYFGQNDVRVTSGK